MIAPASSFSGVSSPLAQKRSPLLRWCQRLSEANPLSYAVRRSWAGMPATTSSGVKNRSMGWPSISCSVQPSTRRAPSFQLVTRPWRFVATTAESVTLLRICWCRVSRSPKTALARANRARLLTSMVSAFGRLCAPSLRTVILLGQQAQGGADDLAGAAVMASADLLRNQRGQFRREADVQGGLGGHGRNRRMATV